MTPTALVIADNAAQADYWINQLEELKGAKYVTSIGQICGYHDSLSVYIVGSARKERTYELANEALRIGKTVKRLMETM